MSNIYETIKMEFKWFLNYATSCTWNENNKSEDVLAQIKRKQMISA